MPHVSGLELIERMKADSELKFTPVMAVTAYAAKGDEERIRDAGAEGYVSKPISVIRFVDAVRALLVASAERREQAFPAAAPETQEAALPEGEAAPEPPAEDPNESFSAGEGRTEAGPHDDSP
jgi:two-component system cell cycle response regulator DivK